MNHRAAPFAGFAIVAAQFSINIGAALGKSLFPMVGPEGVALLRTGIAALILLAWVRPWRGALTRRHAPWLLAYGLTLGSMNLLIYWAIERIPIGIAVAIEITGPLAIVLFTSRTPRDGLWLALALAGLALLIPWPGDIAGLDLLGIACALGAAACWALYILFGKRASVAGGKVAVAVGMATACLVTLPFGVAHAGAALLDSRVLGLGAAVALLSSAIPYLLEMKALERLSSRLFGVITSSAPAIAAICGFLVLGETLSGQQWLAVCAMIGASLGCSLTSGPTLRRARDGVMT